MTDLPAEAVEAAHEESRCLHVGTTPSYLRRILQAAAPAIRHQRDEELWERLTSAPLVNLAIEMLDVRQIDDSDVLGALEAVRDSIFEEADGGR